MNCLDASLSAPRPFSEQPGRSRLPAPDCSLICAHDPARGARAAAAPGRRAASSRVSTGRQAQLELRRRCMAWPAPRRWSRRLARGAGRVCRRRGWRCWASPRTAAPGSCAAPASGPRRCGRGLLEARPDFRAWAGQAGVVDVGDVAVNPHLLTDDMLSEAQKQACRAAAYPALAPEESAAAAGGAAVDRRARAGAHLRPQRRRSSCWSWAAITAWPGRWCSVLKRRRAPALGIVQPDAHTDLLAERLGVRICFATWAYHANDLIGRSGRLVQVGVRASRPTARALGSDARRAPVLGRGDRRPRRGRHPRRDRRAPARRGVCSRSISPTTSTPPTPATLPRPARPRSGGLQPEFVTRPGRAGWGASSTWWAPTWSRWRRPIGSPEQSEKTVAVGSVSARHPRRLAESTRP